MCLSVHSDHFRAFGSEPAVVKTPILVWKRLNLIGDILVSPFRKAKYQFGVEKGIKGSIKITKGCYNVVEVGLHAYTRLPYMSTAYPAIIPANSSVFMGHDFEIVSDRLIVFKCMTDLEKTYPGSETKVQPWSDMLEGVPEKL